MGWTFYNSNGEAMIEDGAAVAATKAEMETATATSDAAFVRPGRTQYHPGVAKAWAALQSGSTTLDASHNIDSATNAATGKVQLTFSTNMSSVTYSIVGTTFETHDTSNPRKLKVQERLAASYQLRMTTEGTTLVDVATHSVAFGDQ